MPTVIVGLIVVAIIGIIIRNMILAKKNGKSSCGCGCDSCGSHCHDHK